MKVISGRIKGRSLKTLKGLDIRPTPDKVKGALFNIIGSFIINKKFLDLFAGTGNIGIEALSRGAEEVFFVDNDKRSIKLIRENLEKCGIYRGFKIFLEDGIDFIRSREKKDEFDLIFLDPPYGSDLGGLALEEISKTDIIEREGLIIYEHFHKCEVNRKYGLFKLYKQKRMGDTCLSFFHKEIKD
ncbi:MAG TPA: 16S rRNA (guanine(966)-N(2))-methyltransferase RsmD [Nitrospinota bacterium]|nr:16S rRNA (guanine(966)-N(2))-methyltransferase RsmD [Nitrospinota bacterium]